MLTNESHLDTNLRLPLNHTYPELPVLLLLGIKAWQTLLPTSDQQEICDRRRSRYFMASWGFGGVINSILCISFCEDWSEDSLAENFVEWRRKNCTSHANCDEIVIFCLQLWFNTYMPQNQKLKPYIDIIPVKIISTSSESVHSVLTWIPPQLYYQLQSYLWSLNSLSIVSVSEPRWMWMSWWPTSQARHQSDRHHRWTTSTSSVIYLCWLFL